MEYLFIVSHEDNKKRIVDILKNTHGMSSILTKKIRLYGSLKLNGVHARMIDCASTGDEISAWYFTSGKTDEKLPDRDGIKILYSDKYVVMASKPGGMVTHPVSIYKAGTLTSIYEDYDLHPVSRLDRETSGIILLARDSHSHYMLSKQHIDKTIKKEYVGICYGLYENQEGFITSPICKRKNIRMLRHVSPEGAYAKTKYSTIKSFPKLNISFMRFELETGRTHQIRVHSLYSGHPLLGDSLYGAISNENAHWQKSFFLESFISRQALHAEKVAFYHPFTNKRIKIHDELPEDMNFLLEKIKLLEEDS